MNTVFKFMTPKTTKGRIAMVLFLTALIAVLNVAFLYAFDGQISRPFGFIMLQSTVVGGPFVVLFVMTSAHQLNLLRRLSLLSRKDGLTGLNNRRTFLELAQKRLDMLGRGVLILLDADHFKRVNDEYGHSVGDHCLEEIAHRLKWNLRVDDVAGRLGGEEFAIFFAGATIEQARVIGARIGQPIPFRAPNNDQHLSITLSIGAVAIDPFQSLDVHLVRADDALYNAKDAGRACMIVWTEDMTVLPSKKPTVGQRSDRSAA